MAASAVIFARSVAEDLQIQDQLWEGRALAMARMIASTAAGALQFHDELAARESIAGVASDVDVVSVQITDDAGRTWAVHRPQTSSPADTTAARLFADLPPLRVAFPITSPQGARLGQVELVYSRAYLASARRTVRAGYAAFALLALVGALLTGVAIANRQKRQRELERTDRLSAIGQLSAGVAHEINNPLAFIIANMEFAQEWVSDVHRRGVGPKPGEAADVVDALSEARDGADRIRRIVLDLKDYARGDESSLVEPTDLNAAIERAATIVRHDLAHRAELKLDLTPEKVLVRANEGRLVQVAVNLLRNAYQAMSPTSAVRRVTVCTRVVADAVFLDVTDTGAGIRPEHLKRLFEPFFTTKKQGEGTGLGLAVCRGIVESFSGEITVKSTVGVGTVFTIRLERMEELRDPGALKVAALKRPARATSPTARTRVLVVDDEPAIAASIRRLLGDAAAVETARDGDEALRRLAGGGHFDVVLCDLMMPGKGGVDVYDALVARAAPERNRFVFVTGGAFAPRENEFLRQWTGPCLEKPFTADQLHAAIAPFASGAGGGGVSS